MRSVLHLSHFDEYGGSARSGMNIHKGLRELGLDSRMIVGSKSGTDPDVAPLREGALQAFEPMVHRAGSAAGVQYLADASSFLLARHPWFKEADVLQLYNLHGGWFAHTALPLLSRRKPTIWRLSDMWSMTGHCGYAYDCERWLTGCGSCPNLGEYPPIRRDATAFNWRVKQWVYAHSALTIVAPSRWLAGMVERSPLIRRFRLEIIPNGVDTTFFAPGRTDEARRRLSIPPREPVVLVGSLQPRKGGNLVSDALESAARIAGPFTALVMGPRDGPPAHRAGFRTVDLGVLDDPADVATAYSASAVMLQPTLADNLPNSILESMASGTPVVALARGGVGEAITHLEDGFLAAEPTPESLGVAVARLLRDEELRSRVATGARLTVERRFSLQRQAEAFRALYEDVLAEGPEGS